MELEHFKELYRYNEWAWHEVLACVDTLTAEQFEEPNSYSVGSIHQQIVHAMSAEWLWLSRLQGTSPPSMFHPEDFPTLELIREKWEELQDDWQVYLASISEKALDENVSYRSTEGETMQLPAWSVIVNVVNHATNHRAQILARLHEIGAPTCEMDLYFFLLSEQQEQE